MIGDYWYYSPNQDSTPAEYRDIALLIYSRRDATPTVSIVAEKPNNVKIAGSEYRVVGVDNKPSFKIPAT